MKNKYKGFILILLLLLSACGTNSPHISVNHGLPDVNGLNKEQRTIKFQPQAFSVFTMDGGVDLMIPSDCQQVLLVAGAQASEANFWLYNKSSSGWELELGPRYCRIGAGGITGEKKTGDGKTPTGLFAFGSENKNESLYTRGLLQLVLDNEAGEYTLVDYGDFSLYTSESMDSGTIDGSIAMRYTNLKTLLLAIDDAKNPIVAIISADQMNWTIEPEMPSGFVYLPDEVHGILEQARYATSDNFTGAPLPGYAAERIVVSHPVAAALKTVQHELGKKGLGLLVYDGYRPSRAAERMLQWIYEEENYATKDQYYPNITRTEILNRIYVAAPSTHSQGMAVDLTIVDLETGQPLDMGGSFDFFDESSSFYYQGVTPQQYENRLLLRQSMMDAGFEPYDLEWWHFNYGPLDSYSAYLNFAIGK